MTDAENSNVAGATVTISTNYKATDIGNNTQDLLSYAGNGTNIGAGAWNATTGILTLTTTSGQTATLADYMTALANVKYTNSSEAPDIGAGNQRTITWQVTDVGSSNASSSTVTSTISVSKVNDIPTNITLSNNGVYAASPVGTVIGSLTVTDPDLTGDTHTFSLLSGTTEFAVVDGKDTSQYTAGSLTVNLATLNTTGGNGSGVYPVTVQVTDGGGATYSKAFSITVVSAPFTSGNMTTVGDAAAVATLATGAKTLMTTLVTNLAGTTTQSTTLTNDNLRTMILAKLNQQLTGGTSGLEHVGKVIDMMGVSVTSAPKIEVTMRVKALSTMYSRLPASVQTSFKNLVDTISPYGASYTFDVRLTVVPSVNTGTRTITYDNANSKLEVLHLKMLPDYLFPTSPYSLALDTLVSSYNGVLSSLKTDGTLAFFLGGGVPKHVVDAGLGSSGDTAYQQMVAQGVWTAATGNSKTAPASATGVRLDYYLPGKVSNVTFNTGNITLVP